MAQVTVTELAKTVGASTERLLSQMKEAGLPHTLGDEEVSDQEKQGFCKLCSCIINVAKMQSDNENTSVE